MLVRWRLNAAEEARQTVLTQLASARSYVEELRRPDLAQRSPQFIARTLQDALSHANESVSTILNTSDDSKAKADALITRGDLYWQLANFPELPGATTQPSLRISESSDDLLKKSADAYNEVLKTDAYVKQKNAAVSAHFGLAAIAENHRDWDTAREQLELITKDPDALPPLVATARKQLTLLPQMQTPLYLAPATQPVAAATDNIPMPLLRPSTQPSTTQASQ